MRFKDIDPTYYDRLAQVESSNNPKAKAKTSTATGLYQFTDSTWKDMVEQLGLNYTLQDREDPVKSRKVVEAFTNNNRKYLENKLGIKPTSTELYLSHFMGVGGSSKLLSELQKNPSKLITEVASPAQVRANKSIFLNKDGSPKTVRDIYNWSADKFGGKKYSEVYDKGNVYSKDDSGNVVTVNPSVATEQEISQSDTVREEFYSPETQKSYNKIMFQDALVKNQIPVQQAPEQQQRVVQQEQAPVNNPLSVFSDLSQQPQQQESTQQLYNTPEIYELQSPQENEFLSYFLNPEFQQGGEVERDNTLVKSNKLLNLQAPDKTSEPEEIKDFFRELLNSEDYKNTLIKNQYNNPDNIIKSRLKNLNRTKVLYQEEEPNFLEKVHKTIVGDDSFSIYGSVYRNKGNNPLIILDQNQAKGIAEKFGNEYSDHSGEIIAHELGHSLEESQNISEIVSKELKNRMKVENIQNTHDSKDIEAYADIMGLKYELFRQGVYNPIKEKFTEKHLEEYHTGDNKSSFLMNRLLRLYDHEDLIWLMNNIASSNEDKNKEVLYYAQEGGSAGNTPYFMPEDAVKKTEIGSRQIFDRATGMNINNEQVAIPEFNWRDELNWYEKIAGKVAVGSDNLNSIQDVYNDLIYYKNRNDKEMSLEEKNLRERVAKANMYGYPTSISELNTFASRVKNNEEGIHLSDDGSGISEDSKNLRKTLNNKYYKLDYDNSLVKESEYRPTKEKNKDTKYFDFDEKLIKKDINFLKENFNSFDEIVQNINVNEGRIKMLPNKGVTSKNNKKLNESTLGQLLNYTMSVGEDEKGRYISYYDIWDVDPPMLKERGIDIDQLNNPFEIYGRIYEDQLK